MPIYLIKYLPKQLQIKTQEYVSLREAEERGKNETALGGRV